MKKHSILVEIIIFSIIFTIFILPPFFSTAVSVSDKVFSQWNFPLQQLVFACFAFFLYLFFYEKKKIWLKIFPVLITTCSLFCCALLIKFFSLLFVTQNQVMFTVKLPDSFFTWLFCLLNFFLAAFYEEIFYRFYFTDALISLFSKIADKKIFIWIFEIAGCVVFAFAHFYLGVFSVINACLAHIVLRICYKKSGSIWFGVFAHFIYNVISLILL